MGTIQGRCSGSKSGFSFSSFNPQYFFIMDSAHRSHRIWVFDRSGLIPPKKQMSLLIDCDGLFKQILLPLYNISHS
ncbi:hypothetical protein GDO78_018587 [Eleutherodactylus coqui]|uniref:Uncharacterized protein n=1 Tax=Eleutherodactylus coqui TaxID=57060 RepID=A0A8J6B8S4_ELECQ|nr:hypothetical protein GDO78_018587 [Eleutherodactylus coqui]